MSFVNLPKLLYVELNGIDVSSYVLEHDITEVFDKVFKTINIAFKNNISDVIAYNDDELVGKDLVVYRGVASATERCMFRGYVRNVDFFNGKVIILGEDKLSQCKFIIVNTSYHFDIDIEAGVVSEIVKDLLTKYTTLSYSATSIQDSGTINILKKFLLKQRVLMDALNELAYTLDWQIYYDSDDDLIYFEPKGFITSTIPLNISENVIKLPKWTIDSSQLFNKIIVKGTQQEIYTNEGPYKLDGSNPDWNVTSLTLDKKPVFTQVFSDTANPPVTEKIGGISNSTTTYDYEVDTETYRILWNTSQFTPTTNHYAIVNYSFNRPIQVSRKRDSSITKYTNGIPKVVSQFREDIKTVDDAEKWADKQLDMYSEPFYSTVLAIVDEPNLKIGSLYQVNDNIQGVNRLLMIKSIKYTYPYRYDIVDIADKEFRISNWGTETAQRLKRLEEKNAETDDLITTYIDSVNNIITNLRYTKLKKEVLDLNNSFVLGHHIAGVLGTSKLGVSITSTTYPKVVQGNMTYEEYGYDTDFHDAVNSTATFSTATKDITFAGGQIWYSQAIDIGTTLKFLTVTLGTVVGDLKIEISSDNKVTWQTVTNGVRTAVTISDGTGTYIKITETSSGVATIDNTYDIYGQYTTPCVKCYMEE